MTELLQIVGYLLALAAAAYMLLALWRTAAFRQAPATPGLFRPPVTVLVPLHGAPEGLYRCLQSICQQDYPHYEVILGLHTAADPALEVARRLQRNCQDLDIHITIDANRHGSNPKISNLLNMYRSVQHEHLVMVDSDVLVDENFLQTVIEPLQNEQTGAVTCLYKGLPLRGIWSKLGAMFINDWFIPSALVDMGMRELDICYGAAIATTRQALGRIGGLTTLASSVAEDDELGAMLYRHGYRIVVAPYVVATSCIEASLKELFRHELRWMRSVRACRSLDHCLSMVTHATPLVALILCFSAPPLNTLGVVAGLIGLRVWLHYLAAGRTTAYTGLSPVWLPVREVLNLTVWLSSFLSWRMHWNGQTLQATGSRQMETSPP